MWMNVQTIPDGKQQSINFDNNEWKLCQETVLLTRNWDPEVMEAKSNELRNLQENNTFEEVEDQGQDVIDTKWVLTEKVDPQTNETKVKARLVAKGYQEDTEEIRKDSPTCSKEHLRILLSLAAAKEWPVRSLDVKSTFLQGKEIC